MSAEQQDYVIEQGEDTEVTLVYKTKATPEDEALPVDLTGYSARMDIAIQGTSTRVWTFNSSDDAGASPIDETGNQDNEATLGSDGTISINIPRSLSLSGGPIFINMAAGKFLYAYDLFLRNPEGKQKKVLKGTITVTPSVTLWA